MRQCPRCGWQVADGTPVCPTCGAALAAGSSPEAATPDTTAGTVSGDAPTLPGTATGAWLDAAPQGFTPYPAPPTQPGYPGGYAGGYPAPPGYTPYPGYHPYAGYPGYPGQPGALPPAPKRRTGLIVLVVALVALLLVSCVGATILALNAASVGVSVATSAVSVVDATATAQAANTTNPPASNVIFQDPLTSNANGWLDDGTHCTFKSDGYYIGHAYQCFVPIGTLYDATLQVQAELTSGPTNQAFGFVLRRASLGNEYYFFMGGAGQWSFWRVVNGKLSPIVNWSANDAIKGGLHSVNTIKITMKGSQFDFYINDTHLGSATDSTFSGGRVALITGGTDDIVRYTNLLITEPQP